jgi:hypothetical protein
MAVSPNIHRALMRWGLATVLPAFLAVAGCGPVSRGIEAAGLLRTILAGDAQAAAETTIAYAPGRSADVYRGERRRAGLLLVPGAAPEGKDHPRLMALARALAESGFLVMVPDLPSLRRLEISSADAEEISVAAAAFHRGEASGLPLGIAAISYAVGPAVIAVLDPAAPVRFVLGVGGYYDTESLITYFTTGAYRKTADEPWRHGAPNAYGKWVFVASNLARLDDPRDAEILGAAVRRAFADPANATIERRDTLSTDGKAVAALLENRDPDRVPDLIGNLPSAIRAEIEALSLAKRDFSALKARLILVHGRDDPIIPSTESEALAHAAPGARAFVLDALRHVDFGPTALGDMWNLWLATCALLAQRDG